MANLGTLWFGADIDLTQIKNKINQGNKDILETLKVNYDYKSYEDMVSRLRHALSQETFAINIVANNKVSAAVQQAVQGNMASVRGTSSSVVGDPSSLQGLRNYIQKLEDLRQKAKAVGADTKDLETSIRRMSQWASWMGNSNGFSFYRYDRNYQRHLQEAQAEENAVRRNIAAKRQAAAADRTLSEEERKLAQQLQHTTTSLMNQSQIMSDLKSMALQYLGVWGAQNFLHNIIEIGGQLERQRLSMGAILQDTAKANELFGRIKGLAIKSPFGVVELDQYSKQLAAYGFKYHELYDMTKRLADISAGAGTDISRIALALGHVRAEGALSGYTLRQFAMNNIPMLQKLADMYSELEKKVVTTAEVRKRVSKKEVGYEDVVAVIKELTDEGGMFYNMQEIISDSVSAKFKNLKDAMDIMYGEMAESKIGDVLKSVATELTKATRYWKVFLATMGAGIGMWGAQKLAIFAYNRGLQANTAALMENKLTLQTLNQQQVLRMVRAGKLTQEDLLMAVATRKLTVEQAKLAASHYGVSEAQLAQLASTNALKTASKGMWASIGGAASKLANPYMLAMVGVEAYMAIWSAYSSWIDRIDEKTKEAIDLNRSRISDLEKEKKANKTKPTDELGLRERVDKMKEVLANSNAYTKTLDEQIQKAGSLSGQYDVLAGALDGALERQEKMKTIQEEIGEAIKASSTNAKGIMDFVIAFGSFGFGMGLGNLVEMGASKLLGRESSTEKVFDFFFYDDIEKNTNQLQSQYTALAKVTMGAYEYKQAISDYVEELLNSNEVSEKFKNQLRDMPLEEQIRVLSESPYWDKLKDKMADSGDDYEEVAERLKDSATDVNKRWQDLADHNIPKMVESMAKQEGMELEEFTEWARTHPEEFSKRLDELNEIIKQKEPEIRRGLKRMFFDFVSLAKLEEGIAGGADIGGVITDEIDKYLNSEELASPGSGGGGGGSNTGASKRDEDLDKAKAKLAEYKAFLSEYKKYREEYSKEKAISILENLFPNLKGQGADLIDNYANVLDKLRGSLSLTTEARKKFATEVDKTKADAQLEREKEQMEKNVSAMQSYISELERQWKLYHELFKKTGSETYAQMAFKDMYVWDDASREAKKRLEELAKERDIDMTGFSFSMDEEEMKRFFEESTGEMQKDMVSLAQSIRKIITKNTEEILKAGADATDGARNAVEKLEALYKERERLVKKQKEANYGELKSSYTPQIAAIDKQIASQTWEAFKEQNEWGRIFANLDNISTSTLENLLTMLRQVAPTIMNDVQATKALYEAMEKVREKVNERNPFSSIFGSMQDASTLNKYIKQAASGPILANAELSRILGVPRGTKVTKNQLEDKQRELYGNLPKGFGELANDFKALEDVLSPVIDLFDQLGMTELSDFFQMGNNALGAASQVASGLNAMGLSSLGPYGAAAGAALSMVSSLFAMQDAALQKEIEASKQRQKELENLTKNLDKALERMLGGIYRTPASESDKDKLREYALKYDVRQAFAGSNTIGEWIGNKIGGYIENDTRKAIEDALNSESYYDTKYAELLMQRDELIKQQAAEREKKKSDDGAISDYDQQIEEIKDEIEHFAEDVAKAIYDIDIKSWASELGDALFEAWQKGEDGIEAFKKKANKMIAEVAKKIVAMTIIETALNPVLEVLKNQMAANDGKLTAESIGMFAEEFGKLVPTLLDDVYAAYDAMDKKLIDGGLGSMKETDDSNSSSNGIKGITEETADLLASYINAIRADVSIIRMEQNVHLPAIAVAVQRSSVLAEAQVTLQQQIAANTLRNAEAADAIRTILDRATKDRSFGFNVK